MATATTSSSTPSNTPPTRRPYHGSCHCGHTKYIAYITLPPPIIDPKTREPTTSIYKCNCTTCQKMSYFHLHVINSPEDFLLLSPLNPDSGGLLNYKCFDGKINWYFCGTCGGRCFIASSGGEVREVEVEGEKKKVWTVKREGWNPLGGDSYLSINASTLDAKQEGLDLREWADKGWIAYVDCLDEKGEDRLGEPHVGGMY